MGMFHMEQLNVLREHNKDLLKQLKQENEAYEHRNDCNNGRVEKAEFQVLTDRSSAQASLAESNVPSADQTLHVHMVTPPPMTAEQRQESAQRIYRHFSENYDKEKRQVHPDGSFLECGELSASARHCPPLLGYDWIAGVLEIEDSVIERSDEFFNDLRSFRSHNKEECVHSLRMEFSEKPSGLVVRVEDDPQVNVDTHQCTFSYRINSRLFPTPLHSERCPVCKKHKSSHPHTLTNPALIRVGIPRAAVLPPYKYRAHRRCSFNPSDGLGLPSHCLTGWTHRDQNTLSVPSSLDLRSSVGVEEGFSVPQASNRQMSNVSRLTHRNFPHFPR